ncbi:MAG: phenylalanine--tRNA ligase subunit beta [Alphaproteobacteria bacterium]|nr:phenylalanine--tRNA ligase subunit beta [Alphaproteobacteria bacterium]
MKFTLSWLKEHLETDASLATIEQALTAVGLEVEAVVDRSAELAPFTVAHVIEARQHPNADRLRVCVVDTGAETIQVVCGAPNARTGMKSVLARPGMIIPRDKTVLKVGQIRGEASQGMLCSASELMISDDHDGIIDLPVDAPVGAPFAAWMGLDDPMIEIAVTPNRPDCLGVRGIARDLAAAGFGRLKPLDTTAVPGQFPCPITVRIDDLSATPVFMGRMIRGVRNGPSPAWLQQRLQSVGLRSISTLVDITNWFTIALNRPLHVFDAARVQGGLRLYPSPGAESFRALNGKDYTLDAGMTAIGDDSGLISLAGIMGGDSTGCTEATTDVFLEAAYFDPLRTARTGRALGIHSDARHRFERGIDPAFTGPGIEMATRMILDLCGGEASDVVVAGAVPDTRRTIAFRPGRVESLGGVAVEADTSASILTALGFEAVDGGWCPPSWRPDIEGEADLVEEVLRIRGFDLIPITPLPRTATLSRAALSPAQRRTAQSRRLLAARGLTEAVTWSFMPKALAAVFGGASDALTLANPIASDLDQMRPSILPNLLQAAARNHDRGTPTVALFEVGPCYRDVSPSGQEIVATLVRSGAADRHWRERAEEPDLYTIKADVLAVLAQLGVPTDKLDIAREAPAWYHPGRSGVLKLGPKTVVARFGELHPGLTNAVGLERAPAMAEVFLEALPLPKAKSKARPLLKLPAFQPVRRDFAFLVERRIDAAKLVAAAMKADKTLITRAQVFDVYEGKGIPEGMRSLALSVELQPIDRTLTDVEIEAVAKQVIDQVAKATGATLRS